MDPFACVPQTRPNRGPSFPHPRINRYGACGYGVDVSCKSVDYAASQVPQENKYCCSDALTFVPQIPTDAFDGVMSFGSLQISIEKYEEAHPENQGGFWLPLFCSTIWDLVRSTKPHRKVVLSAFLSGRITRDDFQTCMREWQSLHTTVKVNVSFIRSCMCPSTRLCLSWGHASCTRGDTMHRGGL